MSCPSCSLQLYRRIPGLVHRAAAISSMSNMTFPSQHPRALQASAAETRTEEVRTVGLRKFVESITKKPKEARLWLKYFQIFSAKSPGKAFAVIRLTPDVFCDIKTVRKLAWSAAFLFENNLMSVLVCQLGGDADWHNVQLLRGLLAKHDVSSNVIIGGDNTVDHLLDLGRTHLPIVCCPTEGSSGDSVQKIMVQLCSSLHPLKVMHLSNNCGLKDAEGKVISDILLPTDLNSLIHQSTHLSTHDQIKIIKSAELLRHLSCESSVVLTSPDTLIQELFTHHGSGTMIRQSEKILCYTSLLKVKTEALEALINESFHKKLNKLYFDRVNHLVERIYISERCNAAAIILRLPNVSVPYLDKIAISEAAQGNGISVMLWNQITKDYPQLFWRSKRSNRAAIAWYSTVSQGSWKTEKDWTIFWYGLQYSHHLTELIDYAKSKETDFYER